MATGTVKTVDGKLVVELDDAAAAQLGVAEGDTVFVHREGEVQAEGEAARQLRFADEFLDEYLETFQELAR